jgi:hypothetical protein
MINRNKMFANFADGAHRRDTDGKQIKVSKI